MRSDKSLNKKTERNNREGEQKDGSDAGTRSPCAWRRACERTCECVRVRGCVINSPLSTTESQLISANLSQVFSLFFTRDASMKLSLCCEEQQSQQSQQATAHSLLLLSPPGIEFINLRAAACACLGWRRN